MVGGGPVPASSPWLVAMATGLEQLSWRGLDNLSVPLSMGVLWSQLVV